MKALERKRAMKISDMKKKTCAVDPKLKNSTRKAPPIHPRTCKEGSRSLGNDGKLYVIRKGKSGMRWTLENELSEAERKAARKRLGESGPKKSPKTPKRKKGKSVLSRIPAAARTPTGKRYTKKASSPKKKKTSSPKKKKTSSPKKKKASSPKKKKASARIPAAARTPKGKKYN
jgi:hypothetical protein